MARAGGSQERKKILVSNPGKQYVHQLLYALFKNKLNFDFFTSFWYKPGQFPFSFIRLLPDKVHKKMETLLGKRYYEKIEGASIKQFPYVELLREFSEKAFGQQYAERMQYFRDRFHDKWVASKVSKNYYDYIIGYEETCFHTFRKARKEGITTILDLAQVHYLEIDVIAEKYPVFKELYKTTEARKRINEIKEEELSLADYIICLSQYAKGTLTERGFDANRIFVANLGFDPEKFYPKKSYSKEGKLNVVFAGTITKRKGIDTILEAHNDLRPMIDLTLIGPMADAEDLLKNVSGEVTYYPYVDHHKLNALLNQADLFVFPSYLDSWAMVVIEAMACGLPVIVSENTGAKEAIGEAGFIIPPGNCNQLKEKINYFYHNRDKLEQMGKIARERAVCYTWEHYHSTINQIILKVRSGNEAK